MGIKEENLKLFGKIGKSTKRRKLPLEDTVLADYWVPSKETRIMFDTAEFFDYCGMIGEPQEFIGVQIKPDGISGHFYPPRLREMLEFCKWFPEYSIISVMHSDALINQPRLGARYYLLANRNRGNERILCHGGRNNSYEYAVAGYSISPIKPLLTLQQFLRALGMAEESDSEPGEN